MSKDLDALEKINHTICLAFNENNNALFNKDKFEHIDCKDIYEFIDCYNIIEKALKERDEFELKYAKTHVALCKSREENSKEKQALKIIKKKKVDVRAFIEILGKGWTWEQYMEEENDENTGGHQFSNDRLTQEEYDLLKEVLEK